MATNVVPIANSIVPELLTKDNYAKWSVYVKNYLLAQDLFDIVEGNTGIPKPVEAGYKTWRKTNARALHAIHISCGPEIFSQIRKDDSAQSVWKTLAGMHEERLRVKLDVERCDPSSNPRFVTFVQYVESNEWSRATKIIMMDPKIITSTSRLGKRTALHIAVIAGQVEIVKELVDLMPHQALELKDNDGYTALALAAKLTGNTEMAKCMVTKNPNLVSIMDNNSLSPVVLASAGGHTKMTKYLYDRTPPKILRQNDGHNGALLFTHSITSEIFDVAWHLLQNYNDLPIAFDFDKVIPPFYALARLSTAFPCRGRLDFLKQWICPS